MNTIHVSTLSDLTVFKTRLNLKKVIVKILFFKLNRKQIRLEKNKRPKY